MWKLLYGAHYVDLTLVSMQILETIFGVVLAAFLTLMTANETKHYGIDTTRLTDTLKFLQ